MENEELKKILEELRALPAEVECVEFKRAARDFHFNDIGKYFSALSNEANLKVKDFGWLVFGVDNATKNIVGSPRHGSAVWLVFEMCLCLSRECSSGSTCYFESPNISATALPLNMLRL